MMGEELCHIQVIYSFWIRAKINGLQYEALYRARNDVAKSPKTL